jgi:hypothetical protein
MQRLALGELIENWPDGVGDTLEELALLSTDTLKSLLEPVEPELAELVWQLRGQSRDLIHAHEREAPLGTPSSVVAAFRDGALRPKRGWWIVYPLDKGHRRISAPHKRGGSRFVVALRSKFPTEETLPEVDAASGYLVAWGGTPDVLSIKGVPERIANFPAGRLVDVVCWDAQTRTLHSLRFGFGESTDGRVEFPDAAATAAAQLKEALWP